VLLKFNILKLFFIIFFITNANAITIPELSASFIYGENESIVEACKIAKDNFFDKARRQAYGSETISGESFKICTKSEDENNCKLFSNTFRSIGSIQIIDHEFFKFKDSRDCKIAALGDNKFEAIVKGSITLKKLPEPDINFDFRVEINKNDFLAYPINKSRDQLKKNDILKIDVETIEDMYISIFQWLPYQDTYSIQQLFPNVMDKNNFFKSNVLNTVPSKTRLKDYSLRVHYPDEEKIFTDDVQEFLMIIGTKNDVNFFDKYNFAEFGAKLAEIDNFRQYVKAYIVRKRVD
tara:strand:- start:109 stop:987 length:879 start_codon:yes stop_codon:yes gene_type:complete